MSTSPEYATFHFHALHHADQPLLLPNAWDVISAVALAGAGYAAVGTTSLGVAAPTVTRTGAGSPRSGMPRWRWHCGSTVG